MEIKDIHEPPFDCTKCPRLSNYRKSIKIKYPNWHNKPVKSFGSIKSKKLIKMATIAIVEISWKIIFDDLSKIRYSD